MIDYNTRLLYTMKYFGGLSMRYRFRMKEEVDGSVLDSAVQKTMNRYPYLKKKLAVKDGKYVMEDNPSPVPVIKTVHPMPVFGSEELNEHLVVVDYDKNDIYITMSHNLGGGRGLYNWSFSILYQYVCDRYGTDPGWEGVRRSDVPPLPGEEMIQPFDHIPDMEPEWMGFPDQVKPILPSEIDKALNQDKPEGCYMTVIELDSEAVMERVRALHASPAVWFAVVYYRALLSAMGKTPEYTDMGVTCDVSDQFGCTESMSLVTKFLHLVYTKEDAEADTETLCQKGRSMLKQQRDPGATAKLYKKEMDTLIKMEELPGLEQKAKYYLNHSLIADMVPSALVSYVGNYEIRGMDSYVDQCIVSGVCNSSGLVITAANGTFLLNLAHKYEDAAILSALEEELKKEGIVPLSEERNIDQNNVGIRLPEEQSE